MQKNIISSFYGSRIYSEFRKSDLLKEVKESSFDIKGLTSSYLHVIESKKKLASKDREILSQILTYGEDIKEVGFSSTYGLRAMPKSIDKIESGNDWVA